MQPAHVHLLFVVPILIMLVASCFLPDARRRWAILFQFLVVVAVVVGRWPVIFAGRLGNPDESQIIAGAATLWQRPEFWKWVDGTTIGPLSFYSLWLGKIFGLGFTYLSARLTAALFFAGTLVALFHFLRSRFPEAAARVSALPFATFGCLVLFWDMVQYGNESAAIFLFSVGLALAFPRKDDLGRNLLRMACAGVALGAVPFAKLHVAPMALYVGVTAVIAIILGFEKPGRWSRLVALIAGALTVPTIAAVYLSIYNLWNHFFISYVENNLAYTQSADFSALELVRKFLPYLVPSQGMLHLFLGTLGFLATCIWLIPSFSVSARRWTHWSMGLLMVTFICIVIPGRAFEHYQLLLIPPLMVLCGCCLGGMFSIERPPAGRIVIIAIFLLVTMVPLATVRLSTHRRSWAHLYPGPDELRPVVEEIQKIGTPGEMMAIWGWQPDLWVGTGLIQGTRDGNTVRQLYPGNHQVYYRWRFMFDIRRNVPPVFLDTAGPGRFAFEDRAGTGHQTWPDLAGFVAEHYVLHSDVAGIRIYLRKDRAAASNEPTSGD
ncbi:MAG TPA: hypothetical protein VMM36_10920 [Opitutaceae bacterium]|nr:hypothetical protein [Opitutaceae bacterium]